MKAPWMARGARPREGDVLVMGSRFVLVSPWRIPAFLASALQVRRQALGAPGNLGVSVNAQVLSKTFWTLSAWTGEEALHAFVGTDPHRTIMRKVRPWASEATFRFWNVPVETLGSQGTAAAALWSEAKTRISDRGQGGA